MSRKGFTLIELVVVCLIIGILAAFAVPQYLRSVENGKAESAATLMNMVGTTNRMYALEHGNVYASGNLTNACNTAACPATPANPANACDLVACRYLAADDWDSKPYQVAAAPNGACPLGLAGSNIVACVKRRGGALSPYNAWGYAMGGDGTVSCAPGCGGAGNPPKPSG